MRIKAILPFIFLVCLACKNTNKDKAETGTKEEKFDKTKWAVKKDGGYVYRDKMLNDLIANYKLAGMKKAELIDMLGQPGRTDSLYLFYPISKTTVGQVLTLHSKTLVIKLTPDSTVEWRKIHQ